MKVTFNPDNYQPTGVVSSYQWSDSALTEAIRQVFAESSDERIVELIVKRDGITAVFVKR